MSARLCGAHLMIRHSIAAFHRLSACGLGDAGSGRSWVGGDCGSRVGSCNCRIPFGGRRSQCCRLGV